tara:strand:+ start:44088 stop:45767 length:1680 start_codon:yes stop_codon:yes gene_type:complete
MKVKPFEHYFSNRELLKVLCRKRVAFAKKEHDKLFHKKLLLKKGKSRIDVFYEMFPSRNSWLRLTKKERNGKSALEINAIQLERTVLQKTRNLTIAPTEAWHQKLIDFINVLKVDVLRGNYSVPPPKIIPQPKEKKNGISIYRPIAHFQYKDRIIISQCNKYLTDCFDPLFEDCSYAFRSIKKAGNSFTHHAAVEDIINYKKINQDVDLYVSECDIKKFYDCVNHNVVKDVFNDRVNECKTHGINIDSRAKEIFYSYLNSYTFNFDVQKVKMPPKSKFGWVTEKELLTVGSDPKIDRIGVPQGGAISCLIANLLMHEVDKKVINAKIKNEQFYARFCDDMVLINPSKEECQKVLDIYSESLTKVKLLSHPFTVINEYSKAFWKSKSKAPYLWAKNNNTLNTKANVPWLSFVGYQLNYDLRIRVRRSSLKKEINKQVQETGKVITLIRNRNDFRISEKAIKFRLTQRLLSMSVGRRTIFYPNKDGQLCWTAGFKLLKQYNHVKFQPKHLDRKRAMNLSRLDSELRKMDKVNRPDKNRKKINLDKEPKYYGYPFSYYSQFK